MERMLKKLEERWQHWWVSIYNARDGPSLQQHVELRVVSGGVVLRRSVSRSRLWKSRCCFAQRRSGVVFHGRLHVEWRILLGLRSGIHCGRRLEHCLRAASRTTVPGTPPKGKVRMLQITINVLKPNLMFPLPELQSFSAFLDRGILA